MNRDNKRWLNIGGTILIGAGLAWLGPRWAPNVFGGQIGMILFLTFGFVCYDLYFIWREGRSNQ
jgi:hypothetical protein